MAVVALTSLPIANAAAKPRIPNAAWFQGGVLKEDIAFLTTPNADDSIGSTYRVLRVSSSARVSELTLSHTAMTGGAADVGLYRTAADGGAVVDADFFASAVSIAAAADHNNVTFESGVVTVPNRAKRIWEQLGLTADPFIDYDVVLTLTAAITAAGSVVARMRYVDGA